MTTAEYNEAVREYSKNILRYLLKIFKDQDEANDILQDAYLKLWQHRESLQFSKSKAWLFTTAHNLSMNKIKRDKKMESIERAEFDEPYSSNGNFELKELINKSLERLTPQHKSIVLLRDLEGYNYAEIGEMLNLSESQVKVYLFRARQNIKNYLKSINTILYESL